jgi:hypothetical protein
VQKKKDKKTKDHLKIGVDFLEKNKKRGSLAKPAALLLPVAVCPAIRECRH